MKLSLSVGSVLSLAAAATAELGLTTWSGSDCGGTNAPQTTEDTPFTCYSTPGAAFSDFGGDSFYCVLTTWSGTKCDGTSSEFAGFFEDPTNCYPIPFGSYSVSCPPQ